MAGLASISLKNGKLYYIAVVRLETNTLAEKEIDKQELERSIGHLVIDKEI